jgi:hypothetical protein
MFKFALGVALAMATSLPALADGMEYHRHYYHYRHHIYLSPERHVVEVVQPPWSGSFVINGAHFTGFTPACRRWAAGERTRLVAGDWHGVCATATFYNLSRHSTCETWCR